MSSRYGERGRGRYGDPEDDRTEDRYYERDAERGLGSAGARYERGPDYGLSRRGGYSNVRRGGYGGGYEREHGQERDDAARDYGSREYGSRYGSREYGGSEYGPRYGREPFERGGYAGAGRRQEGEEYGRAYGARAYGRDYSREREYVRDDDDRDEVREYDTDYGRTTSRFYGRSGYEYGRDDYDDDRGERGRRAEARGRDDDREGGSWLDRAADQVRSWFGGDDDRERGPHGEERRAAHGRGEGKFRGRGPKNYRRSDDRLREEVCDRLTDNEWLDASEVEVNVVAGEVILTGTVDSRYAKRLAENIAETVSGVSHVQNNLRVQNYQTTTEAPLAGMDTPLPTAQTPLATPASDITATTEPTDLNDPSRPSSRAAGQG